MNNTELNWNEKMEENWNEKMEENWTDTKGKGDCDTKDDGGMLVEKCRIWARPIPCF